MVWRWPYTTLATRHIDRQSSENGKETEATLGKVKIENNVLDNVYSFEYLGSRLQGDGDDEADVRYRMDIAQAAFPSLSHLWMDHRLSRNMKLKGCAYAPHY